MKHTIFALTLAAMGAAAHAADEKAAAMVVKKYSEAIACQVSTPREDRKQYRVATIFPGYSESEGFGSVHVVYWSGDVGCQGGNGTVFPQFTVVEHTGFHSASPVVALDYQFPKLSLVVFTGFSVKNGSLVIQGLAYGPDDRLQRVTYTLTIDEKKRAFFKQ